MTSIHVFLTKALFKVYTAPSSNEEPSLPSIFTSWRRQETDSKFWSHKLTTDFSCGADVIPFMNTALPQASDPLKTPLTT